MYSSTGPIQLLVGILVVHSLTCRLSSVIYSFKCDVHLLEQPFPGSSGWSVVLTVVQDASYITEVNVIKIKMMLPRICIYIYINYNYMKSLMCQMQKLAATHTFNVQSTLTCIETHVHASPTPHECIECIASLCSFYVEFIIRLSQGECQLCTVLH